MAKNGPAGSRKPSAPAMGRVLGRRSIAVLRIPGCQGSSARDRERGREHGLSEHQPGASRADLAGRVDPWVSCDAHIGINESPRNGSPLSPHRVHESPALPRLRSVNLRRAETSMSPRRPPTSEPSSPTGEVANRTEPDTSAVVALELEVLDYPPLPRVGIACRLGGRPWPLSGGVRGHDAPLDRV